jgi:hypothetical protein
VRLFFIHSEAGLQFAPTPFFGLPHSAFITLVAAGGVPRIVFACDFLGDALSAQKQTESINSSNAKSFQPPSESSYY